MSLVEMSACGAVMVLAVTGIRAAGLHRLPKRTFVLLWNLVLLRLLAPFSLPSPLSIFTAAGRLFPPKAAVGTPPAMALPAAAAVPMEVENAAAVSSVGDFSAAPGFGLWKAVWLAGVLACGMYFAASYFRCGRVFRTALPADMETANRWREVHRLRRPLSLRQSDRILAPLTYGIVHPVILLPKGADRMEERELQYVLAHEFAHIRHFDALRKLVLIAAVCVHWFNPAVWLMYVLANRDMELCCDEAVVRQFGGEARAAYAMTLIGMRAQRDGLKPFSSGFGGDAIRERLIAIMKFKKRSVLAMITAALVVVGAAAVFATSAAESPLPRTAAAEPDRQIHDSGTAESVDYREYEPFGLVWNQQENTLYYDGEKVRFFEDCVDLGAGVLVSRCSYYREGGTVNLCTERDWKENGDGSMDPFGELQGLVKISDQDAESLHWESEHVDAVTLDDVMAELESQSAEQEEVLQRYVPFGLEYTYDGMLRMRWQGKDVHSLYDTEAGIWIANSMRGLYLGPDAIDLETVYEDGKLTGLKASQTHGENAHSQVAVAQGVETAEGTPLPEMFEPYRQYGVTYEGTQVNGETLGNLYYHGRLVNSFADIDENGGTFTFASSEQSEDGLELHVVYENGRMTGVSSAPERQHPAAE